MSLLIFESKNPNKDISEDLVYVEWPYILVLDGATPQSSVEAHYETISFVHKIKEGISRVIKGYGDLSLEEIVVRACKDIGHYRFRPSATMCFCRITDLGCEYILLGDAFIYFEVGSESKFITDDRLQHVAVKERNLFHSTIDPIMKVRARDKLISVERNYRNREGGYWVLDSDMDIIETMSHAISGVISCYNSLMISTDGILKALKYDIVSSISDLFKCLKDEQYSFVNEVRSAEIEHDDISVVVDVK